MSNEEWIPGSKSELMLVIEREWNLLMDVVAKLDDSTMTTPDEGGWSAKDNLAHLTEWMNSLMGVHIERRPPHEVMRVSEDVTKDWDMEVINPVLFERNKDRSVDDVLAELKQVYDQMITKLDSMSYEDLLMPRHDDDPEKRPLILWIMGDTSEHFAEHRETIEKML